MLLVSSELNNLESRYTLILLKQYTSHLNLGNLFLLGYITTRLILLILIYCISIVILNRTRLSKITVV